jgi:hypothetical protein
VLKIKPSVTQVYQHKEFRTTSRLVQSSPVQYNPDQTSPEQANAKRTQFEQNSEFKPAKVGKSLQKACKSLQKSAKVSISDFKLL